MAPGIHPPCTPSSSCQPVRCHPTPPPCQNPEKCLANTRRKNIKPCQSALSVLRTRSASCGGCGKSATPRSDKHIEHYLRRKSRENRLKKMDRLSGTHKYRTYVRSKGSPRRKRDCCAGHGHRGRLKRGCTIL